MSGSEVAIFSLTHEQKNTLQKSNKKSHKRILKLLEKPELLLATVLTANSFINIAFVIIFVWITNIIFTFQNNEILAFIVQTIIAAFLILLIGEVLPKTFATHKPLKFAEFTSLFLILAKIIFYPFIITLSNISNFIKIKKKKLIKFDELSDAIDLASKQLKDEKQILKGIVNFTSTRVNQIMIPRIDVKAVDIRDSFQKVISIIKEIGYSRMPVIKDNFDQVIGILYIKDLLPHLHKNDFKWQSLIRPPYFVPETKFINDLLEEFQQKRIHMAIVVDEYGGTSGIVTLEDILEEIVGNIDDEFDTDTLPIKKLNENQYEVEGKVLINDFCKFANIDESIFDTEKKEAETIAGLILHHTGNIPAVGESLYISNVKFEIKQADDRRIKTIIVTLLQNEQ